MFTEVENLVRFVFIKLLENKIKFHFANAILNFLENPKIESFILIAKFSHESYNIFEQQLIDIKSILNQKISEEKYKILFMQICVKVLSDYNYTFEAKTGTVQSTLTFALLNSLSKNCIDDFIDFLCTKELSTPLCTPQINQTGVFSTVIHRLLEKGYDETALKAAIHFENKLLLFVKNFEGITPIELAAMQNCNLCLHYMQKIKQLGENVGIIA